MSGDNDPRGDDPSDGGDRRRDDAPSGSRPEMSEDAIEESLHDALNDLEQILEHREGKRTRAARSAAPGRDDDDQYSIPLLDDVVIPGTGPAADEAPPRPREHVADERPPDERTLRRRLAARLASEVEVIVQDRVEAALETAREEIREQVRNHMDIVLPEIVDELIQLRRRKDR